jgi:hypothetical protein
VLTRLPKDRAWWHGHLVRSNHRYNCELLGRTTTIQFLVQKFGIGGTPQSKSFFLTLDGEGITVESGVQCTGDWSEFAGTEQQKLNALHVRQTDVPLLVDDQHFQQSI